MTDNQNSTIKYYSPRAITIATYLGGPVAAGYLARQNFINMGKADYGKYSMIIGIISTLLIFIGIFSVPENIINKIPNMLIPLVYTAIIYLVIQKLQGSELKVHKENQGDFHSAWKAAGIGSICMVILVGGILGYAFLMPGNFDTNKYDSKMAIFSSNENKALELFDRMDSNSPKELIDFIDKSGIPVWQANLKILSEMDGLSGIYEELVKQDAILRNYCNLRIEQYQLLRASLVSNSKIDEKEMERIVKAIDSEVAKLNE